MACDLAYPRNDILFVNKVDYEYTRWHVMGVVAYYCNQFELGASACKRAIENGAQFKVDAALDESNLKYYMEKLNEIQSRSNQQPVELESGQSGLSSNVSTTPRVETKKTFCARTAIELRSKFPKMTTKQIESRCNLLWKAQRNRESANV